MPAAVRLLLVGEPHGELSVAASMARDAGADVVIAGAIEAALDLLRNRGADMMMIDVGMDIDRAMGALRAERIALPVLACGINAPAERAVAAIRAGARDYVPLPAQRDFIAAAIASIVERGGGIFVGAHPAIRRAHALAAALAANAAPVLIGGEPGSGKETLAREIHRQSGRGDALVIADCAGISAEILESELFGHEVGAFPGAVARRVGKIESAGAGTIVLREVGALAPATQARLMRMLDEGCFLSVGGTLPIRLRARLIATTSLDLESEVRADRFRADLLTALELARVNLPPLRDCGDDRVDLARHFAQGALGNGMALSDEALALIAGYRWPGNIRELKECIERAALLARGATIAAGDLIQADGRALVTTRAEASEPIRVDGLVGHTVEEVERELILQTLRRCQGNRTSASHILGISVRTMRNKLRSFIEAGIPVSPAL